ncbi:MAG: leucine-rich repeat protein, partial [Clostridia bacterium]|nr:leucine-rich repeat protein [Clostridia bacterium]
MVVAILDTGLDYTHEAFQPDFEDGTVNKFDRDYIENKVNGTVAASANDPEPFRSLKDIGASASDVYVNSKVPFAFDYADRDADVYPSYSQHGTHVAGIVAGKADKYKNKDGKFATDANGDNLLFRGVAPEAQLVICKVFTDDLDSDSIGGAEAVDILDALEDCYNLDVDVINMSLGTSAGFSARSLGLSEEDEEGRLMARVYKNIRDKGISLVVAASNEFSAGYGGTFGTNLASNPDSGTVGSPSTFTGALSVASINGQLAHYMLANATEVGSEVTGTAVYYEESRNEDSDSYDFLAEMLIDKNGNPIDHATYKYVMVPGTGEATDYTSAVKRELQDKGEYEKVIAVVQRGRNNFKDKIITAVTLGADAVIVYNNVSGMIRMSLGDMNEKVRVPSASISLEVGNKLKESGKTVNGCTTGTITLDKSYLAGPFMNDYSSWGVTPDLKLKPDVTSHGGEITSTVAGGYDEMSGTSMACPNLAGFTALLRSYLKNNYGGDGGLWTDDNELTKLTNNIIMSTAKTVYDQNKLPYSPRKQGAGLATLSNVFSTQAYLYTKDADGMCEDGRPKAELGDDKSRKEKGVYDMTFYVKNFGETPLTFKANSIFMTDTIGEDGKSVAEKAHIFADAKGKTNATWTVGGTSVEEGGEFTVPAGEERQIKVTLKLSSTDIRYLEKNFENGMFVEGFLQLISSDGKQCDLNFPFVGFYGDWKKAPMLDLDCFEVAKEERDSSKKEEERRKPSIWATQAFAYYYNDKYTMPLGSFAYTQDEKNEHTSKYIYTEEEHIAISRFNDYEYEGSQNNYLSTTGIKALYAGLLRNAEIVTYTLTNVDTGEIIPDENGKEIREVYRVGKSFAGGGNATPSQVLLELRTDELGLEGNGKYRLDFDFYFDADDYREGEESGGKFSMNFYIDYEAPVLLDSRLRFQDEKAESGKVTQNVYLDLDIYDNHYPQAVILCYNKNDGTQDENSVVLATDYITPVLNPAKNSVNTVSIDITQFYADYKGKLFVELDDYALNHNVYSIMLDYAQSAASSEDFTLLGTGTGGRLTEISEITVKKNQTATITIGNAAGSHAANYTWISNSERIAKVNGMTGEVFGVNVGETTVTVTGKNGSIKTVTVKVVEGDDEIKGVVPYVSFGTILNAEEAPVKATGIIQVNPAQEFTLELVPDPWYFPLDPADFVWTYDHDAVEIKDGKVKILYEEDTRSLKQVTITATHKNYGSCVATVTLVIRNPYTVSNGVLTRYRGWGGTWDADRQMHVLKIPNNKSITTIGEEAFKDNENVNVVIIPKGVTTIRSRAFENCVNLKKICFIDEEEKDIEDEELIADSSLNLIEREAFKGCTSLETVDLTNCKVITVDRNVFTDCTGLKEIIKWKAIGTIYPSAFAGCTSLESADLRELHIAGDGMSAATGLFSGCTSLSEVITGKNTALGAYAFAGCTALKSIEINCSNIPAYAFYRCSNLETVTINGDISSIGAYAFANCTKLTTINNADSHTVSSIGDSAFRNCSNLTSVSGVLNDTVLGNNVFANVPAANENYIKDNVLVKGAKTVTSSALPSGVTEIGAYAFSGSTLSSGVNTIDLTGVTKIGTGAFSGLTGLTSVVIPDGCTEIPANAFRGTSLTEITVPASVTKIGAGAFAECASLATVNFNGTALKEIGASAFTGTALTEVNLPSSVTTVGSQAFSECDKLASAELPAVTDMGYGVFAFCPALTEVTFGDNATTVGTYTFTNRLYIFDGEAVQTIQITDSALTSVTLGKNIKSLGAGAFAYCDKLESITLTGASQLLLGESFTIGQEAFGGCTSLATVEGLEKVAYIEPYAFANCASLRTADLSAARAILYAAFSGCRNLRALTLGSELEGIGDEAFASNAFTKVVIPASVEYVGVSAFSSANGTLSAYEVAEGNKYYFAENGALYRYIDKENGTYEFVAYPEGRTAALTDTGYRSFTVKEGTVTLGRYSFASVNVARLNEVIFPYTLKSIGAGAFYGSGIVAFRFESIAAPTLLERFTGRTISRDNYSSNSMCYDNFTDGTVTETIGNTQYVR